MKKLLTLIIVACITVSCATTQNNNNKITTEASKKTKPSWISTPPLDSSNVYAVGIAKDADSLEKARTAARNSALSQIAGYIGINIKSTLEINDSTEKDLSVASNIQSETENVELEKVQFVDEYYEKTTRIIGGYYEENFDVYVLAKYSKASAETAKTKTDKKREADVMAALRIYKSSLDIKNITETGKIFDNLKKAEKALERNKNFPLNDQDFKTVPELQNAISNKIKNFTALSGLVTANFSGAPIPEKAEAYAYEVLSARNINVTTKDKIHRFETAIIIESEKTGDSLGTLTCRHIKYRYEIKDLWKESGIITGGGEEKGFGKTQKESVVNAFKKIVEKVGDKITENRN